MRQDSDRLGEIVLVRLGWAALGAIAGGLLATLLGVGLWWLDVGDGPEAGRLIVGWLPVGLGGGAVAGLLLGPHLRPLVGWMLRAVDGVWW